MKKRDRADEKAGVGIFSPPKGGATGTVEDRLDCRRYTAFARATRTRDIFIPGVPGCNGSLMLPTSQSELALPSTENCLPSRLSST